MNYKQVKAIEHDGDWYLIPVENFTTFLADCSTLESEEEYTDLYYDLCENFDNNYGGFKTGGDLNLVDLYIKA